MVRQEESVRMKVGRRGGDSKKIEAGRGRGKSS